MTTAIRFDSRNVTAPARFGWGLDGLPDLSPDQPWQSFEPAEGYADPDDFISPVVFHPPYHPTNRPLLCVATAYDHAMHLGTEAGYAGELPVVPEEYDRDENLRMAWIRGWGCGDGYLADRRAFERDRAEVEAAAFRAAGR